MNEKIITKVLAGILAFILVFANIMTLGICAKEVYAASDDLEDQNTFVNNSISFDAYFEEEGEEIHSKEIDLAQNNDKLYVQISVSDGYLKNGSISLKDANFKLIEPKKKSEVIQDINLEENIVYLNRIDKGESVTLELPIEINTDSAFDVESLDATSKIVLEGTFVNVKDSIINTRAKENEIYKEIEVHAKFTAQATAKLEEEITKYIKFEKNDKKGVILQTSIKSSLEENILPVKQTELTVEIPKINNIDPTNIVVSSKTTEATNGERSKVLTEKDYEISDGEIIITIENTKKEDGKVAWVKDAIDEIIITYIYEEDAVVDSETINLNTYGLITVYDAEMNSVGVGLQREEELTNNIGDIVSFDIDVNENKISKGYMLVPGADNTIYVEKISANVGNAELVDSLEIENNVKYLDENENKYESKPLYTYINISEENFNGILGEEGYIKLLNKDGEEIARLSNTILEYKFDEETTYIKVETSKPIKEGILELELGREIKSAEYDEEQTKMFTAIETEIKTAVNSEEEILNKDVSKRVKLEEPTMVAVASINKDSLSTLETNEKVEIRVVLETNSNENILYKNPKVTLELPKYITSLSEAKVGILYDEELKLGETKSYKNDNGNIVVEIPIEGEQTAFNTSSVSNGATVVMFANMEVDSLTPAVKDTINVNIENEEETVKKTVGIEYAAEKGIITRTIISNYSEENQTKEAMERNATITISADTEMRNPNIKIDVVNSTGKDIANVKILGRLPFAGNKKIISEENFGSTFTAELSDKIIGNDEVDIYYSENGEAESDLDNEENEWSKEISDFSNIKSYLIVFKNEIIELGYTNSFEYGLNLPEDLEGGQSTYTNFVVYYNEVEKVENGSSSVNIISEDLRKTEAPSIGIETKIDTSIQPVVEEINPTAYTSDELGIEVKMTSDGKEIKEGTSVKEGQYIDYEVIFTNKTPDKVLAFDAVVSKENATFYGYTEYKGEGTLYDEPVHVYDEIYAETITENIVIGVGTTKSFKYTMVADAYSIGNNLVNTISIKKGDTKVFDDTTTTNPIIAGKLKLTITRNGTEDNSAYSVSSFPLMITAKNISDDELSNIKIELELPDLLSYKFIAMYAEMSEYDRVVANGNKIKYTINKIEPRGEAVIYVSTETGKLGIIESSRDISVRATASTGGTDYSSNTYTRAIEQIETKLEAKMSGSVFDEYVSNGDEIIYTIDVENIGLVKEVGLKIQDEFPSALEVQDYTIIYCDGTEETIDTRYNNIIKETEIDPQKIVTMKVRTIVNTRLAKTNVIDNNATVSGFVVDDVKTNTVSYKIRDFGAAPEEPTYGLSPTPTVTPTKNPDVTDNPDYSPRPTTNVTNKPTSAGGTGTSQKFSISGIIWSDDNSNGRRDTTESGIADVTVMLMNNEKSEFVKDSNGNEISTKTNASGQYEFKELESGEYVVVFMYDSGIYKVTTYQANGINTTQNSDAIDGTIKTNGVDTKVALTDIITVGQASRTNIDLGLITAKVFDLKLDKIVNTVVIQNAQGTKTNTFKNNKMAKVEIPAKYIVGSNITIEYKIRITNEGDVAGKVGKIVDYMPNNLEFSSDINPEWYKGTDGYLYTEELKNTTIQPGETKEVSLVLTKIVRAEESEISNNSAEISENYNSLGLKDIDSTPGNKDSKEDDFSEASLIITIKTGAVTYTFIALMVGLVMAIVVANIYLIKRKTDRELTI